MGTDYYFSVKRRDTAPGRAALSFALSRASSMGPLLARYARLHGDSSGAPERYVLTPEQWEGFAEELYGQRGLLSALASCVLSVFDFDPDVPEEIRPPEPPDWERLARFEHWLRRVFGQSAHGSPEPVFSLDEAHFRRGVSWAWDLRRWLELAPEIREALRDPQSLVFLDVG